MQNTVNQLEKMNKITMFALLSSMLHHSDLTF